MKRLLILWLTLLGSFWLTRAVVSALLFQHVDRGAEAVVPLVVIPLLQTLVVGWLTRPPGGPPSRESDEGRTVTSPRDRRKLIRRRRP